MKNIVKWMESLTAKEYCEFTEKFLVCNECPAKGFCQAKGCGNSLCAENFHQWALLECEEEGGER